MASAISVSSAEHGDHRRTDGTDGQKPLKEAGEHGNEQGQSRSGQDTDGGTKRFFIESLPNFRFPIDFTTDL